jgi:hypothetical protein
MVGRPGCRGDKEEVRFKEQDSWTGMMRWGDGDRRRKEKRSMEEVEVGHGYDGQRRGAVQSEGATGILEGCLRR